MPGNIITRIVHYCLCCGMLPTDFTHIWGFWCQKQVSRTGISNYIPQNTGAKYLKKDGLMKLFYAFVISNFSYCATVWHFCSKSSTIKMEKMQKAALRVVFNDYTADYSQLLSMSKRSPMLIVRRRALLIEVFKCVREPDPIFMNILFTLNSKPYDTFSGSLITQSQVKTIKHGINSFVYQGGKQWNALPADGKDIEDLNVFKNYIDKWTGPDSHCGYCVLCAIKTL